ncbi:MAG: transglutaminase domain-containing protein [Planctomycetes bacterium]|nr:transglutaminase domain-containing protein [Planctomycetota bacterium]
MATLSLRVRASLKRKVAALATLAPLALCGAAEPTPEDVVQRLLGKRYWYGVYVQGKKSGYALAECREARVGGRAAVTMNLQMWLKLATFGRQEDVEIADTRTYFRTGELHEAACRFKSEGKEMQATVTVRGDKAVGTMRAGGLPPQTKDLPKPAECLRDWVTSQCLAAEAAKPGEEATYAFVEPLTLKEYQGKVVLRERKEIVVNGVRTRVGIFEGRIPELGVSGDMVVDERGLVLEQKVGQMFVLRLEPEQQARDVRYTADLVRLGCLRLDPAPPDPAALRGMRFEIHGIEDSELLVSDGRQRWSAGSGGAHVVEVVARAVPAGRLARLPVDREKFAEELSPSPFAQSDQLEIRALAAEIVGSERNLLAAASRINAWVYKNIRKVNSAALSNAAEVLKTREGDCLEHTVLFVALARAAGIPARKVAGVTALKGGEGLYYHAWPEVWVGDWLAMDPTLDQDLADATHVKFCRGGVESFFRIVSIFGRLRAKPLDATTE